jgi:hypothetical protein
MMVRVTKDIEAVIVLQGDVVESGQGVLQVNPPAARCLSSAV